MALDRKRLAIVLVMAGGAWFLLRPRALSVTQPGEVFGADIPPEPSLGTSLLRAGKGLAITSAVGLAGAGLDALSEEVLGPDPLGFISQGDPINGQPALSPVEADLNPIEEIGVIEKKLPGAVIEGAKQASEILSVRPEVFTPTLVGKVPALLLPPDPLGTVGIAAAPNLPQPLPGVEVAEVSVPGINIDILSAGAGAVVGAGVGFGLSQIEALEGTPVPSLAGGAAGGATTALLSGTAITGAIGPGIAFASFAFVLGKALFPTKCTCQKESLITWQIRNNFPHLISAMHTLSRAARMEADFTLEITVKGEIVGPGTTFSVPPTEMPRAVANIMASVPVSEARQIVQLAQAIQQIDSPQCCKKFAFLPFVWKARQVDAANGNVTVIEQTLMPMANQITDAQERVRPEFKGLRGSALLVRMEEVAGLRPVTVQLPSQPAPTVTTTIQLRHTLEAEFGEDASNVMKTIFGPIVDPSA